MARSALKAFTLAEVVVVVALLGLLVILAERLLLPSLRLQRRETALAQTQQRLQLALAQVRETLQASGSGGLFFQAETLSSQAVREVLSDAELAWEVRPCLIWRDPAKRELVRYEWKDSPTSVTGWTSAAPLPLRAEDLLTLRQDRTAFRRLLAGEMDAFALRHEGTGIRLGRQIEIQLESWSGDRHSRWNAQVSLRNSW